VDTWSSLRPSSAGVSLARRRIAPPQPGPARHDPAWLVVIPPGSLCAPGDAPAHARHADRGSRSTSDPPPPPGITPPHRVWAPLRPGSACLPLLAAPAGPAPKNRNTHSVAPVARGFLLWRISYTCRCPIPFTVRTSSLTLALPAICRLFIAVGSGDHSRRLNGTARWIPM